MRVVVRHGHFAFYPRDRSEVLHFRRKFTNLPFNQLFAQDDYFTFIGLLNLPTWSQIGKPYGLLGAPALLNYAGSHPYQVMRANRFVYSMLTATIVPSLTFAGSAVNLQQCRDQVLSPKAFLQPGCLFAVDSMPRGVLTGYTGEIDLDLGRLAIDSIEAII